MDLHKFRRTTHTLFIKEHYLSHKSQDCDFIDAILLVYNNQKHWKSRTLHSIYIENMLLVQPKGMYNGNGDQGNVTEVI